MRRIPSLQTQCDDIIDLISDFCQHNRFQCVQTIDLELPSNFQTSHVCTSSTGQIFVSTEEKITIYDHNRHRLQKRQQQQQESTEEQMKTVLTLTNVRTFFHANPICVDGDELFIVDHWGSQIQVFSVFSIGEGNNIPRRNLPIDGNPSAIAVCDSILIVTVHTQHSSYVCAMTKLGQILWKTIDRTFILFSQCNIFVDKISDEILIYSIQGYFMKIFDFKSGKEKPKFKNWGYDRSYNIRGTLTINAQSEILICLRIANAIGILKFSRDNTFLEAKPVYIQVSNIDNPVPSGFCAGLRGELIIYDCGKLHIIK